MSQISEHPAPSINFDVLEHICTSLSTVSDILTFSLVSSSLRRLALRVLLRTRTITLDYGPTVPLFRDFLSAGEGTTRFQLLSALVIAYEPDPNTSPDDFPQELSATIADAVIGVLGKATHLKALHLPRAYLVLDDRKFGDAIHMLGNLEELGIHGDYVPGTPLENKWSISNSLRRLHLDCVLVEPDYDTDRLTCVPFSHLYTLIGHLSQHLEVLEITKQPIILSPPSSSDIQFPRVHSVALTCDPYQAPPRLDALVHAFPSLRTKLRLGWTLDRRLNIDEMRAENERFQEHHSAWPHLNRLEGDVNMLNALALRRTTVDHLVILSEWGMWHKVNIVQALHNTPPTGFTMTVEVLEGVGFLDHIFTNQQATRLTHLALMLKYEAMPHIWENQEGDFRVQSRVHKDLHRWNVLVDKVAQLARTLPYLTHLRVVFFCHIRWNRDIIDKYPACVSILEDTRCFDFATAAENLSGSDAGSRLQNIFVTTVQDVTTYLHGSDYCGMAVKNSESRGWKIEREMSTGRLIFEELKMSDVENIVDREELRVLKDKAGVG